MFKMMGKKIISILRSLNIFIWIYGMERRLFESHLSSPGNWPNIGKILLTGLLSPIDCAVVYVIETCCAKRSMKRRANLFPYQLPFLVICLCF